MEVKRAETAGFCMGVALALQKLDGLVAIDKGKGRIFTLGSIIHNPQVMAEYARKGVVVVDSAREIPAGATAVLRAHGVPKEVQEDLVWRGITVVDATCPKVRKAQLLIAQQARAGRVLLLYGEESHPEVKGLLSYAEAGAFPFATREQLDALPIAPDMRYCLAAQTTGDRDLFASIARELSRRSDCDISILETICDHNRQRQKEAARIARETELVVVVGGANSGTSRRLVQVVAAQNTPVLHVENAGGLPLAAISRAARVGLTAGASTPNAIIDQIHMLLATL